MWPFCILSCFSKCVTDITWIWHSTLRFLSHLSFKLSCTASEIHYSRHPNAAPLLPHLLALDLSNPTQATCWETTEEQCSFVPPPCPGSSFCPQAHLTSRCYPLLFLLPVLPQCTNRLTAWTSELQATRHLPPSPWGPFQYTSSTDHKSD